jgi:SAM-dependent methyltransferase
MSGFSPEWLALREPVDHRSRNQGLLAALQTRFADRAAIAVVDLGCGTGSNLRATAPYLGRTQRWLLVDHDARLLAVAREQLMAWADAVEQQGDALRLEKGGRELAITFKRADLAADLEDALPDGVDLVTAAALFDLVSISWIGRFARAVASRNAAFYTALTYNGVEIWEPPHPADADILAAFNDHQASDKGFGPSAGPHATDALAREFRALGYDVRTGDSPSRLDEPPLIRDVVDCVVQAARDTGLVAEDRIADWRAARSSAATCIIGHTDLLATPPLTPRAAARAADPPRRDDA